MATRIPLALAVILAITGSSAGQTSQGKPRPRIRDVGITVGVLPTGRLNAITDVEGVKVGQTTLVRGDTIRTGVTAILPHSGNLFRERVPAAIFVGNGFGKLAGSTQVNELGEIETPIVLTSTLSVPRVADAVIDYMLALPGNEDVVSVNPVVGETNDAYLNDIRARAISHDDVIAAIKNAQSGPVDEGAIGAGTGTVAFGFKGGIGTASRRLPSSLGGYTLGVLVQSNFGGILTIAGAPVGRELGRYYLKEELERTGDKPSGRNSGAIGSAQQVSSSGGDLAAHQDLAAGSAMIVIATDAPLDHRNLARMAARAMLGLAYTGSSSHNHSGDYVIAFSTASEVRIRIAPSSTDHPDSYAPREQKVLSNDGVSPLFLAVAEATQEAVYNSMFRATTTSGQGHTVEALPIDQTVDILRQHGLLTAAKSDHQASKASEAKAPLQAAGRKTFMQRRQFLQGLCVAAVLPSCTAKSYADYAPPHYDIRIKSGEIHDPANGLHRRADIGLTDGKIAAIADDIPASTANDVIDARGLHVTPGLIDLHTHCAFATSPYTLEADPIAARSGVTTWVDAGSVPAEQVAAFRRFVVEPAQARIYAFLHMYGAVKNPDIDILQYVRSCIEPTGDAVVHNRDILLGVKFQAGINMNGKHSLELLKIARETCDRYKLPVMVHIGFAPPETDEVMALMHSGDVVTHCFNGNSMGILDSSGKIKSSVKDARARGVLFDLGHGWTSYSFDVARKALDAGFAPDTVSTDLHPLNVNGPVFDLPTTMSKMMYLGMSLDDVLLRTTANAARIINRVPMSGTLQEGAPADIALLAIEEGKFPLMESKHWNGVDAPRDGTVVVVDRRISSRLTICRGKRLTAA